MSLTGGGGSPNVAGSNPSGTGASVNYIGNHAYAHSGMVTFDTETTLLQFTTGSSYIVCKVRPYYDTVGASENMQWNVYMDDQLIASGEISHAANAGYWPEFDFLIPSYTKVRITGENVGGGADIDASVTLVGRVY